VKSIVGKDLDALVVALREILLDEAIEDKIRLKCLKFSKRLLPMLSLVQVNNVSEFTVLETVFAGN